MRHRQITASFILLESHFHFLSASWYHTWNFTYINLSIPVLQLFLLCEKVSFELSETFAAISNILHSTKAIPLSLYLSLIVYLPYSLPLHEYPFPSWEALFTSSDSRCFWNDVEISFTVTTTNRKYYNKNKMKEKKKKNAVKL